MRITIFLILMATCAFHISSAKENEEKAAFQFEKIATEHSKLDFVNQITEDQVHNFFNFSYIYNGAGVAVGDFNNDGLTDIFFSANQGNNKLYLNQGNFQFRDITASAFSDLDSGWKNGVTLIDINNDGWLDIYLSRSGLYQHDKDRENRLYINNGDLTFSEQAKAYGLNDAGFSIQAYFLDYDKDNDLDLFLINHRYDFENNNLVTPREQIKYDTLSSDQLYRNNGYGCFTKVTEKAGIINYAWGLSAVINDFNNDGWDDIYVANDYVEPDNLYINNQDGTFTENIAEFVKHTSYYGMGSDLADINNDGYQDLMVLDMVPEDHVRSKRLMAPMSTENFWRLIDSGLHYQYMLNTLQLNHGNGLYSEISQLAGVSKTDWSWAPLFADFDNDGLQDLFITNGIKRDITDNDFFTKLDGMTQSKQPLSFGEIISNMPSAKLQNYIFKNQGDLTFKQVNKQSQLTELTNSNGAAYADFDNDGQLDLVVNNIDEVATLYKNTTVKQPKNYYLKVKLLGPEKNKLGLGALVSIHYGKNKQVKKFALSRGYLSSVQPLLHFGLANQHTVDHIMVTWPDGKTTKIDQVKLNTINTISYDNFTQATNAVSTSHTLFKNVTLAAGLSYQHKENSYNDFAKESLLPHKQSEHGPYLSVGDVNGDQLDDFFIGGATGSSGKLFIQTTQQTYVESNSQTWEADAQSEDLGSLFFDFDNDNDLDLYVTSGGNEFENNSPVYQDRLYINDGQGRFSKSSHLLPVITTSGLRVIAADYDKDGDKDLFIGGRLVPGKYPTSPNSYLLNNQNGKFIDVSDLYAADVKKVGMISDASFVDFDNDGDLDLIAVGEWMPISLFENQQNQFINVTEKYGLSQSKGWWQKIEQADFDNDGDVDFIVGNIGNNNKYQPSTLKPLSVYANDFDNNGSLDIILSSIKNKRSLPVRGRECSSAQIPSLSTKFPTFKSFAEADLNSIYSTEKLQSSQQLKAELFSHSLVINHGKEGFEIKPLPNQAQIAPISGIVIKDFNNDNYLDILYSGNFYATEVETVRYDAGIGGLLLGDGNFGFSAVSPLDSGFITAKNARDLKLIHLGKEQQNAVLVSNNNDKLQLFKWQ